MNTGFTLIELLIVVALIGVLSALGAPFLVAAKSSANEASAISSLRTLNSGQAAYASGCGGGAYSASLAGLVSGDYVSRDLDISPKSGFAFALAVAAYPTGPADCTGAATYRGYYFSADPLGVTTGRRGFATNQGGTIWQDTSGAAPVEPFVAAGTVSPLATQ